MGATNLNDLIANRLSGYPKLGKNLAVFAGVPAIFNTEFPPDEQPGWEGKSQYPRICYRVDMQVNQERSSAGVLRVAIYTQKDQKVMNTIEGLVRGRLEDVLMKPSDQAPFCVSWSSTDYYPMEGIGVMCQEVTFDILEYPSQETTDPDPIMAVSMFIKGMYPEAVVLGIDRIGDYVDPSDKPVFFCRLQDIQSTTGHCMHSISWFDTKIAVHLLCPNAAGRLKMVAAIEQRMAVEEEIIMPDQSPMRLKELHVNNTADYLREGQLVVTGKYGALRGFEKKHFMIGVGMGFTG